MKMKKTMAQASAVIGVLGLLLVACGDGDGADDLSSASETASTEAVTATTAEVPATTEAETTITTETATAEVESDLLPSSLEIIQTGAEPFSELRYDLADGATETVLVTHLQSIKQELAGNVLNEITVASTTTMEQEVARVGDNYKISSVISDTSATDGTDEAFKAAVDTSLATMIGVTSELVITDRGKLLDQQIEGTDALDPAIADLLEQLRSSQISAPFPDEPIGVGAKWASTTVVTLSGLEIEQTTVFELLEIDESGNFSLQSVTTQEVEAGSVMNGAGGINLNVVSWDSATLGTVTGSTASAVANVVTSGESTQVFEVPGQGELTQTTITEASIDAS